MPEGVSLQALADHTGSGLQGDAQLRLYAVASIENAQAGAISYIRDAKYRHYLQTSQASALILPPDMAQAYAGNCLINPNPYLAYAQVVGVLYPTVRPVPAIHPSAVIAAGVDLGADVVIEAGCVIGTGCRIGNGSWLHANVTLYADTQIGQRCIIHSGAVLGADGFGFAPDQRTWFKIPQVGNVVVGDDVEIGANTTIDRAALGSTVIGNGVKLDNLIQIGHNTQIGAYTAIAACTAVAGSVQIGQHCQIAGMCAIAGHLSIADNVVITGTSMVSHAITKPGVYSSGTTIVENALWRKNAVRFNQLDKLARRLQDVEKQLAALESKGST
ncbi:MAG: UDP-3-O-(3-hydroxymyristoyl)glucosamine N-acyltransferase [Thiothrix lacustris]|uniref:UDP-3-O-acylglucosamine N-acyltransferase n=1 Tax=Thiothrix lacustris TaxID=525917 RepID=A0A1Y1QUL9_9GAMM|nr:MAG: UDP-3-O-(3-hydroxymyristoyl)glucosamine N-acyltransferase [Thiothrix lacustris]